MKNGVFFQQANSISNQIIYFTQEERIQYLNTICATKSRIVKGMGNENPGLEEEPFPTLPPPKINTTTSDTVMLEVI